MLKNKNYFIFLFIIITISLLFISGCSSIFFSPYGSIEVTTYPSGAKIFLDGKDIEHVTPYTINNLAKGTYEITVTLGNISYTEKLKVYSNITSNVYKDLVPRLNKILVQPSSMNLEIGESKSIDSIIAAINPSDCNYSSSSNHAIVDSIGTITGVSKGSATITVSYTDVEITKTDSINVFVETEPPIEPPIIVPEDGAPIANIQVTPGSTGIVPFTVSFDASGSSVNEESGSSITSYSWDFGDGDTGTGIIVVHTYNDIGLYPVILTITDSNGKKDYATVTITVNEPGAPTAVISTVPDPPTGFAPFVMHFDAYNSSADVDITSYDWVFGDGGTGTGASINHTFNTAGTYVTSLTVTDSNAKVGFATVTITVNEEPVPEIGNITVSANPESNVPESDSTITAIVTDTEGQFVADGTTVYFLTNNGALSEPSADTANGMATVTLTLSGMQVGDTATVTAFIGAVTGSIGVTCTSETGTSIGNITVYANPESNVPGGVSTITAIVTNAEGDAVPNDTTVYFHTNSGVLSPDSANTTNGIATTNLTLNVDMQNGAEATVTAFIGSKSAVVKVTCVEESVLESITLSANPISNVPGGISIITAIVKKEDGSFVENGTTVYFTTNSGLLSAGPFTTTDGVATVELTLDDNMEAGANAKVTAFTVNSESVEVTVTCIEPIVTIYADYYIIAPVSGTSHITAVVTKTNGEPIDPDVIVIFFAKNDTGDDIGILNPVYELTSGGMAETDLTALDTGDVVTVTAKCGSRVSNEIEITTE